MNNITIVTFGKYIRQLRLKSKLTLRDFCRQLNLDPSNWSRVERDLLKPPKSRLMLENIAKTLSLEKDSDEWEAIFDLAAFAFIPYELRDLDIITELGNYAFYREAKT